MLEATNLPSIRPMKKLDCKRYGPFEVIVKVNRGAYKLKLPSTWRRIHPVFNEVLLSPYTTPAFENQQQAPPPPPVLIGKEQEYEVESIVDSKFVRNVMYFSFFPYSHAFSLFLALLKPITYLGPPY